jgi:hypothetical protein
MESKQSMDLEKLLSKELTQTNLVMKNMKVIGKTILCMAMEHTSSQAVQVTKANG